MKAVFLCLTVCSGLSAAHAQLLPVPGARNPEWQIEKTDTPPKATPFGEPPTVDRIPNAMQGSISSSGSRHYYWDADRQLAYKWLSRPGSGTAAPDKQVLVREERTGVIYTFRRRR